MESQKLTFRQFLATAFDGGDYATDDIVAFVLPLFKEVLSFHENGQVGPFENQDTLFITDNRLDIDENYAHAPIDNLTIVETAARLAPTKHFEVVGRSRMDVNVESGTYTIDELNVHLAENEIPAHAAYITGYRSYEILLNHHDALTDIFCLGLVLGSVALSLDLYDKEELKTFAAVRSNVAGYNQRIHPTISTLVAEMTELDRAKRAQDLYDVIYRLEHYRDYDPERRVDLSNVAGWVNKELTSRSQFILNKLRNRLFDSSRRNRLLYYKPNMRFVNLTVSSVPMVLHYQSIRPELLFTWNDDISAKVKSMKEIILNTYLRFEDHPYLPSSLDKIRTEAQHDVQEYGFSQLKLVISFLNWHNLKEDKNERIQSPLLLIPVELKKVKKLREDHYVLKVLDNAAEVNPVLANQLRNLFGIKLPDFVDLDDMSLEQFYDLIKGQIEGSNQGITLNYINKPRIKLVHSIARQTVNNYRKRLGRGRSLSGYKDISYSYEREHFKPLGLEIFKQRIEHRATFLEFLVNEDIKISSYKLTGETVKERQLFEIAESESNPFSWDFDLCNMVLGNFNYKKMSLVRDYNYIIDNQVSHTVFENLFNNQPREYKDEAFNLDNPADWHHVITADPTQTKAVLQSRTGESYIIQGPPGTGKSQTITNLVADFVARGKRVLFVCEKRAALDVVYHRLKQQGLDELCCYVHDSQGDKRELVKNLKATYEDFIKNKADLPAIEQQRNNLVASISEQLKTLKEFHFTHLATEEESAVEIRRLIERLVALKPQFKPLDAKSEELIPFYKDWLKFGETVQQLSSALEEAGAEPEYANHPLSNVKAEVFTAENPYTLLENLVQHSQNLLSEIEITLAGEVDQGFTARLGKLKALIEDALLMNPLAEAGNMSLIDTDSTHAVQFDQKLVDYRVGKQELEKAQAKNSNWLNKFSEQDVEQALAVARKNENSFFSFLKGSWRDLKKQLKQSYDFSKHQVKPSFSSILQQLKDEYAAGESVNKTRRGIEQEYRLQDLEEAVVSIEKLRQKKGDPEVDFLVNHTQPDALVKRLCKLNNIMHQLELQLEQLLYDSSEKSVTELKDQLEGIGINADGLKDLLPALRAYAALPPHLKQAIRKLPLTPAQAEAIMAHKTLEYFYRKNRAFAAADIKTIENAVNSIQNSYKQLLKYNSHYVRAKIRQQFLQGIELSSMAPSQLNAQQKQFKKEYSEGRKVLENEFGKSMRFKSIRDLASKESGLVLRDLKPVWLMSPLSVSDTLPLDTSFFDVVIFDEASQITLEEGIPALYRAPQTIIVGDDKQMPPSNFFTARAEDPDDLETYAIDEDDELLSNDADSLLVQGARKLNSVMLGWHYRSRYETLISYSNHAFYQAGLLTIPDKTIHDTSKTAIEITRQEDAVQFADTLYDRSISFHYLPNSVYEKRINTDEAGYIAHLVRELLKRKVQDSIGIVAFSQEQQHTIEDALTALANEDKEFEQLLEDAYNRTDDDQYTGLFVKNLENVQGDERDIIILSVCYGYDARKKIIMNFGPINKKGGEKRLNVIFSRAKKHMAVVSSIKHFTITNEYNEGANYFKRFLHYAELLSGGNMQTARTVLDSLVINKRKQGGETSASIMLSQLKEILEHRGFETGVMVGQSDFKCSLAVKLPGDDSYRLSVLMDDDRHYANSNLLEQYYQRPAILESFGWRTITIFAKDWLQQPTRVVDLVIKRFNEDRQLESVNAPDMLFTSPVASSIAQENAISQATPYDHLVFERLVFKDETSNKFWEVATEGNKMVIRFGRLGTRGQLQVKTFTDENAAVHEKEKMKQEKLNKGYLH